MAGGYRASRTGDGGRGPAEVRGAEDEQVGHAAWRGTTLDMQRARILAAALQVVVERGAADVVVGHIVDTAGVSRRTFYEMFEGRDGCLAALFEQALARAADAVLPVWRSADGSWARSVRAALMALLAFFDEQPAHARLLLVEVYGCGREAIALQRKAVAKLACVLEQGRRADSAAPPMTGEFTVGAVFSVLQARILAGEPRSLSALANDLMSLIALPYLGAAAARRELERPLPQAPVPRNEGPLPNLTVRLTYRTMRVISEIGREPGISNRDVGRRAGIDDQAQASRLLRRLQEAGLVVNRENLRRRGAPNAWELTADGRNLDERLRGH